jgi:cbb3-type cytochrome oxidase subunit 3
MKALYEAYPELVMGAELIPLFAIILLGGFICWGWIAYREQKRKNVSEHDIHQFDKKTNRPDTS